MLTLRMSERAIGQHKCKSAFIDLSQCKSANRESHLIRVSPAPGALSTSICACTHTADCEHRFPRSDARPRSQPRRNWLPPADHRNPSRSYIERASSDDRRMQTTVRCCRSPPRRPLPPASPLRIGRGTAGTRDPRAPPRTSDCRRPDCISWATPIGPFGPVVFRRSDCAMRTLHCVIAHR